MADERIYYGYEFSAAYLAMAQAAVACTFQDTGDTVTISSHGFENGDVVAFPSITTTTGITANTRYYVVGAATNTFQVSTTSGGSAAALTTDGTGTCTHLVRREVDFANQIELTPDSTEITWEGSAQSKTVTILSGLSGTFSPDSVTITAIEALFGKTAAASGLPYGATRGTAFGDTTDNKGITAELYFEGYAYKKLNGVESVIDLALWIPQATLTLGPPPAMQTKQKFGPLAYNFSAIKSSVDLLGVDVPGTSGEAFYLILEI